MARKQGRARFGAARRRRLGTAAVAFFGWAAAFGLGGCLKSAVVVEKPRAEKREAARGELLNTLVEQMNRLASLSAQTRFSVVLQDVLIPATMTDYVYMQSGEPYQKKFMQTEVEGMLLLVRGPEGGREIRVSGVIEALGNFMLLGKNDAFWILEPTTDAERQAAIHQGQSAPRGRVQYGKLEREAIRPKGALSIRPQDVADLLLTDEAYPAVQGPDICYVEKWPDYYVMNFLRQGRPEHIYSKIWIERRDFTVAIHQLYDGNGEVIAEGRFKNYAYYAGKDSKLSVQIPSEVEFLWPRDKLVMHATLSNIRVNEPIPEKYFDEHKLLDSYPASPLQVPPAAPNPSP